MYTLTNIQLINTIMKCYNNKVKIRIILDYKMTNKFGYTERLDVLGPTPCVIERINSQWRFQIIIKNKLEEKGHQFVSSFLNKINAPKDIRMTVDVDPLDIL